MLTYLNPIQWMRWFVQFVAAWFVSVKWKNLSYGIPAVLLSLLLATGAAIAYSGGNDWRLELLNSQLSKAFQADDFDTSELILRRQLKQTPNDTERLYRYALVLDAQGKEDEAMSTMRGLAVSKQNPDAARWVLQNEYLSGEPIQYNTLTESERAELLGLLRMINEKSPKDVAVKRLYANVLIGTERYSLVIPVLDELMEVEPMRGLQAAAISRRLGKPEQADRFADRTLQKTSKLLAEEPRNSQLSIAVAQTHLFLRQFAEAAETLKVAIGRAQNEQDAKRLKAALGESIVAWINHIEDSPTKTVAQQARVLRMLRVALTFAPNNPRVLGLIADRVLVSIDEEDESIAELRRSLVSGAAPGVSHFIRGTVGLMKGEQELAEMHLELALETMPNSAALLNNLAVALTLRPDANLDYALTLVSSAIEKSPVSVPHYHETRGQILFRMEEYKKAVLDMERALAVPDLRKEAHRILAVCYQELGDTNLADDHLEAFEELTSRDSESGSGAKRKFGLRKKATNESSAAETDGGEKQLDDDGAAGDAAAARSEQDGGEEAGDNQP